MKCVIKENSFLAKLAALKLNQQRMALVLGRTIYLYNTTEAEFINNKTWLRHELMHVKQFQQYGYLNFLWQYLLESIRHGYFNNKFERQARAAETDETLETNCIINCR